MGPPSRLGRIPRATIGAKGTGSRLVRTFVEGHFDPSWSIGTATQVALVRSGLQLVQRWVLSRAMSPPRGGAWYISTGDGSAGERVGWSGWADAELVEVAFSGILEDVLCSSVVVQVLPAPLVQKIASVPLLGDILYPAVLDPRGAAWHSNPGR